MYESQAIIERVRHISASIQQVDVAVDKRHAAVEAGQLFLARVTEALDPYLREPWTPVQRSDPYLVIERPANRHYVPGQVISLLGPVGKPIPLRDSIRTLLLIANEATPASLLLLARAALTRGTAVTLALVGSASYYPFEALPQELEIVRAEASKWWPNHQETLRWASQIVAVAPPPFDTAYYTQLLDQVRQVRMEVAANYVYGLFQPPMPCGIGACGACSVRCGSEETLTCLDGPALDLLTVNLVKSGASV